MNAAYQRLSAASSAGMGWRRCGWVLVALLCLESGAALGAGAATAADAPAETARIAAERAAAQSLFESRERECATRFAVNACLDQARKQRRDTLGQLKRRQIALDEAQRQQRAAERQAELRAKAQALAARRRSEDAAPVMSTRKPSEARLPVAVPARPPARAASQQQAQQAQQRRQSQQRKLQSAQAHREAVEKRNAERAAKGKPIAAPLPVPGAASMPR